MKTVICRCGLPITYDDDVNGVEQFSWHCNKGKGGAVVTWIKHGQSKIIPFSFFVTGEKGHDHIDRNTHNNQRLNLRPATTQQNAINKGLAVNNTSGYKGVSWNKATCKWYAQIQFNRKQRTIGSFDNAVDAAKAYNEKVKELYGEFAYINPIPA